jgi:hypothetical protein
MTKYPSIQSLGLSTNPKPYSGTVVCRVGVKHGTTPWILCSLFAVDPNGSDFRCYIPCFQMLNVIHLDALNAANGTIVVRKPDC